MRRDQADNLLLRWIYILEGAFSLVCAFCIYFGLPSNVRQTDFLDERDREIIEIRHQQRMSYIGDDVFSWEEIRLAATYIKVWPWYLIPIPHQCKLESCSRFNYSAGTQFCQNI